MSLSIEGCIFVGVNNILYDGKTNEAPDQIGLLGRICVCVGWEDTG